MKYFESGDLPSNTLCRKDYDWQFFQKYKNDKGNMIFVFNYSKTNQDCQVEVSLMPQPIATAWQNKGEKPSYIRWRPVSEQFD